MKDLEKLLMKKQEESEMSDSDISAKKDVLKEMLSLVHKMMSDKTKGGMEGMQKVSVMAPDKESLKEGLDKAMEIMEKGPESLVEESEEPKDEEKETPEEELKEELKQEENLEDEEDDSMFNSIMKKKMMKK